MFKDEVAELEKFYCDDHLDDAMCRKVPKEIEKNSTINFVST